MHVLSLVKIPRHLLKFTQVNAWKTKILACLRQITKFDEISQLEIPNQISKVSMHIPSLVKIHWCLLKLSSGNENMGMPRADNSVKIWRNLPISNPKPDLHNINAHTKFVKIHWSLLKLSSGNEKQTDDWQSDRHTSVEREAIIPRHYRVAGYKNSNSFTFSQIMQTWSRFQQMSLITVFWNFHNIVKHQLFKSSKEK